VPVKRESLIKAERTLRDARDAKIQANYEWNTLQAKQLETQIRAHRADEQYSRYYRWLMGIRREWGK
jgi:hypothetical protein